MNKIIVVGLLSISIIGLGYLGVKSNNDALQEQKNNSVITSKENVNIKSNEISKLSEKTNSDNTLNIGTVQDVVQIYDTYTELADASSSVIECKVIKAETNSDKFFIYTNVSIEVKRDFLGKLSKGEKIDLIIRGGELSGDKAKEYVGNKFKDKFGDVDEGKLPSKVVEKINGLDNIENGDDLILFLQNTDNKYTITGAYQGRYKIKNGNIQKFNDKKSAVENISSDSLINELNNIAAKKNK